MKWLAPCAYVLTASVAAGAAGVVAFAMLAPGGREMLFTLASLAAIAATASTFIAIALPVYYAYTRSLTRLAEQVRTTAEAGHTPAWRANNWLKPIAEQLSIALRAWSDRCENLTVRLREAEICQKVTEAERRHYEAVLHSLKDAVVVTDAFNELAMANEPAARLLGFNLQESIHKPITQLITDSVLAQQITEVGQSGVVAKQKHFEHMLSLSGPDVPSAGGAFDVTLACLPDPQNNVSGVVTILRDITREKEINQMKSDFVSQASHELRTPLSSINAYVEMLIDAEAEDEASRQEFYTIIKSEADRVSRMIDNMLNISRIEAGIVTAERTEVDFVQVVREVIETMRPQAALKDIMLIEKSGPLVYTAQADRDMMYQVVMNLVSNAIKYTPESGRVTVTVENDDASRSIMVTVADTGLGIPPEALGRLFEKFFRIDNYKRVAKGTGLGLNLVKHIVETVHHGKVGVTSEVGMGSRFWVTIPYEYEGA